MRWYGFAKGVSETDCTGLSTVHVSANDNIDSVYKQIIKLAELDAAQPFVHDE